MTDFIERLLKRLGLVDEISRDDFINASTEDAARDYSSVVGKLRLGIEKRLRGNEALRHSLSIAKARTSSFEEFEKRIQSRGSRNNV